MRDTVIRVITEAARNDRDIMFLSADMGAPALDEFRRDLPDQFIQVGIAEQNMIDVAAGLALSGKKVFCYAMAPFMPARCFEQIKCSLASMNLPVCLIGVGVGLGYDHTAMTHIQVEDIALMRTINHVEILSPPDTNMAAACIRSILKNPRFSYLRLERQRGDAPLYEGGPLDFDEFVKIGMVAAKSEVKHDVAILSTGGMSFECAYALVTLRDMHNIYVRRIDMIRLKPFPTAQLQFFMTDIDRLLVVEEHVLAGGLGTAVMEALHAIPRIRVHRLGLPDGFTVVNGDRAELRRHFRLDRDSIVKAVLNMVEVA
jgi:transketolase